MIMKMKILILLAVTFVGFFFSQAYAREIPITLSGGAENIIFDGKWTFLQEWKPTTTTQNTYDNGHELIIKTGHTVHLRHMSQSVRQSRAEPVD